MVATKSRRSGHEPCFKAAEQQGLPTEVLEFGGVDGRGDVWHRKVTSLKLANIRFFRLTLFQLLSPYGDWISSSQPANSAYFGFGRNCNGMRITHSDGEHLLVLSDEEAAALVEASALLVLASQSIAGAVLPPRMATVLGQLFDGLNVPTAVSAPQQDN
ncbi:hypothetical protein KBY83_09215 [Cyanobium sp. WKJ7-Wakatipu]|uniref:hypothetical protein n=1 Tax=Cyanobium sp. WKJ7-Wakatipu TaxID=2823726 RepID=UPI0020CDF4D2|nr:hypothetical protein [Cyanobium sp. WKJ7-Wakatipu]MCP9783494.1 hypothetical protein [Cyanobium sp. WKJ7-Wakatipu]